jgi:hypothetical protein
MRERAGGGPHRFMGGDLSVVQMDSQQIAAKTAAQNAAREAAMSLEKVELLKCVTPG